MCIRDSAKVYERTLHMLAKYDDKIEERLFSELDVKYINLFNLEMEKDGCCGNTRKYYLKTLRAVDVYKRQVIRIRFPVCLPKVIHLRRVLRLRPKVCSELLHCLLPVCNRLHVCLLYTSTITKARLKVFSTYCVICPLGFLEKYTIIKVHSAMPEMCIRDRANGDATDFLSCIIPATTDDRAFPDVFYTYGRGHWR